MENFRSFHFLVKNIFKLLFIAIISVEMLRIFLPFAVVLIVAALVALAIEPSVHRLENRFKWSRIKTTWSLLFGAVFLFLLPFSLFCLKGVHLIVDKLVPYLSAQEGTANLLAPLREWTQRGAEFFNIDADFINSRLTLALNSFLNFVLDLFKTLISHIPSLAFSLILFILSLSVFMIYFQECRFFLHRYSNMSERNYNRFMASIAQSARQIFVSNILTGLVQATLVAVGSFFCGFPETFLIFFITFIFSFVPLVGTAPISLALAGIGFYNGSLGAGITMLVVALITSVSDNIVRSLSMMSGDTGLHPFISFLSVIGGVILYGIPGLLLGPLVASICFSCLPILIEDLSEESGGESPRV